MKSLPTHMTASALLPGSPGLLRVSLGCITAAVAATANPNSDRCSLRFDVTAEYERKPVMAHIISQSLPPGSQVLSRLGAAVPSRDQLLRSELVWLGLVAYLVVARVLSETVVPIGFRGTGQ